MNFIQYCVKQLSLSEQLTYNDEDKELLDFIESILDGFTKGHGLPQLESLFSYFFLGRPCSSEPFGHQGFLEDHCVNDGHRMSVLLNMILTKTSVLMTLILNAMSVLINMILTATLYGLDHLNYSLSSLGLALVDEEKCKRKNLNKSFFAQMGFSFVIFSCKFNYHLCQRHFSQYYLNAKVLNAPKSKPNF